MNSEILTGSESAIATNCIQWMNYAMMPVVYETDVYGPEGLHRAHTGDAGLDLRCAEDFDLSEHSTKFVSCGIRVQLPVGTFGAIRSRSGLASRLGVDVIDGTVDENFRGVISVTMRNNTDSLVHFVKGDRICQLVVIPYCGAVPVVVDALEKNFDRGENGYGSTGIK